jgi:hypothetical protein
MFRIVPSPLADMWAPHVSFFLNLPPFQSCIQRYSVGSGPRPVLTPSVSAKRPSLGTGEGGQPRAQPSGGRSFPRAPRRGGVGRGTRRLAASQREKERKESSTRGRGGTSSTTLCPLVARSSSEISAAAIGSSSEIPARVLRRRRR